MAKQKPYATKTQENPAPVKAPGQIKFKRVTPEIRLGLLGPLE